MLGMQLAWKKHQLWNSIASQDLTRVRKWQSPALSRRDDSATVSNRFEPWCFQRRSSSFFHKTGGWTKIAHCFISGWWFGTFFIFPFHIWDNPSHWRTHIFQDGYHQPVLHFPFLGNHTKTGTETQLCLEWIQQMWQVTSKKNLLSSHQGCIAIPKMRFPTTRPRDLPIKMLEFGQQDTIHPRTSVVKEVGRAAINHFFTGQLHHCSKP